jgi:hypothetical protein
MNKGFWTVLLFMCLFSSLAFAINPNNPYVQPVFTDMNGMGALLVQEWAFNSIDLAFLLLSLACCVILLRYAVPISMIAVSVMGLATVFAFGFNSIFAWGILIAGIIVISLMTVISLLNKTQY